MKKIFSTILIAGLLLPAFVLASDIIYERTPSGYTIENPVNFYVLLEDSDFKLNCEFGEVDKWVLFFEMIDEYSFYSDFVSWSELEHNFILNLPFGYYKEIDVECWKGEEAETSETLEFNSGNPIFEVIESEEPAGVFGFPSDFVDLSLGYVDEFLNDIGGPVALIFGLVLGMFIINYFLILVRERKKRG